MDYERQIEEISNYIKSGEKKLNELKLGIELEHFIIDKETLRTISYYGENGVAETLKDLERKGWKGYYEGEYILGASKGKKAITLEPGSQFELSLEADIDIKEIEKEYFEFLNEIVPILESRGQGLMATGYHPVTKIDEIKILPKKRYDYMFNYFKKTGTHAHNMMKGTAALQISLDYLNEEDYRKKYRVINALSPVMYAILENARYFENEIREEHAVRAFIWENTDKDRSGIVPGALKDNFGYRKYAEFVLNHPPILEIKKGKVQSTGNYKVREIFDPENYNIGELEHFLTMVFPDVRTKRFMEIRMMDAVPYPLNFSAIALFKGIIYNDDNLNKVYDFIKTLTEEDIVNIKHNMMDIGMEAEFNGKSLLEVGKWTVCLAKEGLKEEEVHYIKPLEDMLAEGKNPYLITKDREKQGKKEALDWCLLNNIIKE